MGQLAEYIELDSSNVEFNNALEFVKHTNKPIYLTGKAGTGKTTFLKQLKNLTTKKLIILAPTGVAAVNAGGQTIHSFFQIPPSVYVPHDKRTRAKADISDPDKSTIYDHFHLNTEKLSIIRALELLIIDEISMVRCDLLDVIDKLLRTFRRRPTEPFGGVQVIFIGDTFQLPPIANTSEWNILKNFYDSTFFFDSKVIKNNPPIYIELKKIYRQNEQEFIDLLNRIRINQITDKESNFLNSRYNPEFSPNKNQNYITLATHNNIVNDTNLSKLAELTTDLKIFEGITSGQFPESIMPTEKVLQLKEGAQVMFIKNDKDKRYYNGKIAKIDKISGDKITVALSEEDEIFVEKQVWQNIRYTWNEKKQEIEEEVLGTFTQYPLKLAWAITVHKSQGLSFDAVIADSGSAFASGQVYVALSRCTSFNGLILKTKIGQKAIKTDHNVIKFAQNETPDTLITHELTSGKANNLYKEAREHFNYGKFDLALDALLKAVKFRNDLETTIFKRLVIARLSRLANKHTFYKDKYYYELKNSENSIDANREKYADLSEYVDSLLTEIGEKDLIIEKQSDSINLVAQWNHQYSEINSNLESEINKSQTEKGDLNRLIEKHQRLIKTHEINIRKQKEIIEYQDQEIERLKSPKWYHKLIGKS